ncbi:MAG: hypothetical protein HY801_01210 [Candidatus Lindowbacteria bacterium]|nr:hypothetical protein [Candidatus Lindowbacteria bacterium]
MMPKVLQNPTAKLVLVPVTYAALGLLLYARCMKMFLAMEDFFHIAWVEQGGLEGVAAAFYSNNEYGLYRPLTIHVYFYLCRLLFGLNPMGYHALNMISQVANGVLVFMLVAALSRSRWIGFIAGVVYLCRMSHFLGVFWVSGIQEVWLAFWYLALPFALVLYSFLFNEQLNARTIIRRCGIFFVVLGCYLAAKFLLWTLPATSLYETGFGIWLIRNVLAYGIWETNLIYVAFICAKLFAGLNPYAFLLREDLLRQILGAGMLAAFAILISFRKKILPITRVREKDALARIAIMGMLFFLISLAPALMLKNRTQHFYLFVPSIGFSMTVAAVLGRYLKRPAAAFVLAIGVAVALVGYRLVEKVPDGRTDLSARSFLADLNQILEKRKDITAVYVRGSDTRVYQVLWYGDAFKTFLHRPVSVLFDFQGEPSSDKERTLTLIYDGEHLHESPF